MSGATEEIVDDALADVLRPGQDILIGQSYGSPRGLIAALPRHLDRLAGSRVFIGMLVSELPELPGVHLETFFPSGALGTAEGLAAHGARYERRSLYDLASALREGTMPVDVVLAQGTTARDGLVSLGISVDYIQPAAARASATVIESGPRVPWTGEGSTFAADRIVAVDGDFEPLALDRPPSARDRGLAANVATWIPDGATLQCGMGPWVSALIDELIARRGLRIHSGLITDWLPRLTEAGAVDGAAPVVATGAAGTVEFYRWLHDRRSVQLLPADITHDPDALVALPQMRAVNSVLGVDLLGRANSEFGHGGKRGGVAGLSDFARGAARNESGLSIIALSATARDVSRIVARLDDGSVALDEGDIEVIVTEHGSADLRGRSRSERVAAILGVAAPEHRDSLEREARELELL